MKIPFNKIFLEGSEMANIKEAIDSGHLQGDGKFMKICEEKIRRLTRGERRIADKLLHGVARYGGTALRH